MPIDLLFRLANTAALAGWLALIVLPRAGLPLRIVVGTVAGFLCALYAILVAVYLFPSGGSFFGLDGVGRLFLSPPVLLAAGCTTSRSTCASAGGAP